MLSRPFRKYRLTEAVRRVGKHVPVCRIAESVGYSPDQMYAWLNDEKAAPTPEQFADVIEWTKEWTRRHDAKQARSMIRRKR